MPMRQCGAAAKDDQKRFARRNALVISSLTSRRNQPMFETDLAGGAKVAEAIRASARLDVSTQGE